MEKKGAWVGRAGLGYEPEKVPYIMLFASRVALRWQGPGKGLFEFVRLQMHHRILPAKMTEKHVSQDLLRDMTICAHYLDALDPTLRHPDDHILVTPQQTPDGSQLVRYHHDGVPIVNKPRMRLCIPLSVTGVSRGGDLVEEDNKASMLPGRNLSRQRSTRTARKGRARSEYPWARAAAGGCSRHTP